MNYEFISAALLVLIAVESLIAFGGWMSFKDDIRSRQESHERLEELYHKKHDECSSVRRDVDHWKERYERLVKIHYKAQKVLKGDE